MMCVAAASAGVGCAPTSSFNREFVSTELGQRVGSALPAEPPKQEVGLPPQVILEDGLDEGESVAVALWNNAAFHSDLAELGVARGDLVEAGLLPNPVLNLVFPGISSSRSGTLSLPIRLLQRRTRVAIGKLDMERVAHSLLQSGLGLARDVRVAFAELSFAREREAFVRRDASLLEEIRQITETQLRLGGISQLEASRIEADALAAGCAKESVHREEFSW